MDITAHVDSLQQDLASLAAIGNSEHEETLRRISTVLEPALRLRLLEVLGEAARELDGLLPGSVEVRLAGGEPSLVYAEGEPEARPGRDDDALSARITLRLAEPLKAAVEAAAAREGVSVNTWLLQTIKRTLDRPPDRRSGKRLSGYARS